MGFNATRMAGRPTTYEGGRAFNMDPAYELYTLAATSLMSGETFYEKENDRLNRFVSLVETVLQKQEDPAFVAALAAYTREKMYLRTMPTILATELLLRGFETEGRKAARAAWLRGDEHLEALAYAKLTGAKRTKALLRAVAERLNQMSEYGMIKYAAGRKEFSQKDAIRLAHPVPAGPFQSALFKCAVHGWASLTDEEKQLLPETATVKEGASVTWEQHISKEGSTKATWEEAILRMGYMALMRNLRNFVEKDVDRNLLRQVAARLSTPSEVEKSKQLPFRYLSAWRALPLQTDQFVIDELSNAADHAVKNVPDLEGDTLVLVDCSASMRHPISAKSTVSIADAARCLGGILVRRGRCTLWGFGDRPVRVTAPSGNPVFATICGMDGISRHTGHGTQIGLALTEALKYGDHYQRAIVITDMQSHDHAQPSVLEWLERSDGTRRLYIIDMAGYGRPSFAPDHPKITMVAGWSDKVFNWIEAMEKKNPLQAIREYIV